MKLRSLLLDLKVPWHGKRAYSAVDGRTGDG